MPVSEALRRLSTDPAFWSMLRTGGGAFPDEPGLRVSLPITGGYGLTFDVDPATGEQQLGLREPATSEPVPLGRATPGGPYPAALTFAELDLCARVLAVEDPDWPHPGLAVALLAPFAPPGPGDDPAVVAAVREAAYRALRRDVPPPAPSGPEQDPLPLFTAPRWWPAPHTPSPQVIDEASIAEWSLPAEPLAGVRGHKRFPRAGLHDLVRRARTRLDTVAGALSGTDAPPVATKIAADGDLALVPRLLTTLTEAGYDHPVILDALTAPVIGLEACWVVETLAGATPGSLVRRHLRE